jgi:hypothetical protein
MQSGYPYPLFRKTGKQSGYPYPLLGRRVWKLLYSVYLYRMVHTRFFTKQVSKAGISTGFFTKQVSKAGIATHFLGKRYALKL